MGRLVSSWLRAAVGLELGSELVVEGGMVGLELESELLVDGGAGGLLGLWVCDGGFVGFFYGGLWWTAVVDMHLQWVCCF
uniref:Uncharacterized protein n=1 Tax=Fagus sylvatica TaxID=28930 RepID=A0A2N9ILX1_FAGSY